MAFWLFKEEPSRYSFADLEKDGIANWGGVSNALAQKHLRSCQPGDLVFFYHTGKEKAIVGIMQVTAAPTVDPDAGNEKFVMVPVKPVRRLEKPVTLAVLKADKLFADWELIRIARLSVMPCSVERWKKIEALAATENTSMKAKPTKKKSKGSPRKSDAGDNPEHHQGSNP